MKYEKIGVGIKTELKNTGYTVMALINKLGDKESRNYSVSLLLNRNDIGAWDEMDSATYVFQDIENINLAVYDFIIDKYNSGFFERFINRYEHYLVMIDKGIESYERENMN